MEAQTATPTNTYPKIKIAGQEFEVRFTLGAMFRMERYGIDFSNLQQKLMTVCGLCQAVSCAIGNLVPDNVWVPAPLSPEEVADGLEGKIGEAMKYVAAIVAEAVGKAPPSQEQTSTLATAQIQ